MLSEDGAEFIRLCRSVQAIRQMFQDQSNPPTLLSNQHSIAEITDERPNTFGLS